MEPEALKTAAILFAAGQVIAAALALAGCRRSAAIVTAVVAGAFLLLMAAVVPHPAPGEILMGAGEALGLLTMVVIAFRPKRPWFWLLFWLAWLLTAYVVFLNVALAFVFRVFS
jgi:predicted signal transduction protein with EAL and GGDEF domain